MQAPGYRCPGNHFKFNCSILIFRKLGSCLDYKICISIIVSFNCRKSILTNGEKNFLIRDRIGNAVLKNG